MACSSEAELRRLAATVLRFMSGFDVELMTNLARDAVRNVRHELAISLSKVGAEMRSESDTEQVDAVVAILRRIRANGSVMR